MSFFDLYQKQARETAVYPRDQSLQYLTLGAVNEMAELFTAVDQFEVGDMTPAGVAAEGGDVMWYVAEYATEQGWLLCGIVSASDGHLLRLEKSTPRELERMAMRALGRVAGLEKKRMRDFAKWDAAKRDAVNSAVREDIILAVAIVRRVGKLVAQVSLEDICAMNLSKLGDRKDRGVIQGDGDKR